MRDLPRHNITATPEDWSTLQGLAERLVRDSDLLPNVPRSRATGKVSALLRLIAQGKLIVTRCGESAKRDE